MSELFTVRFDSDFARLAANLDELGRRALPYAAAAALSQTAVQAREDYRAALPGIFDRPTPYTLNSAMAVPARKGELEASVELKYGAAEYLGPEIEGGARAMKRSEKMLDYAGVSEGAYTVPGRGADLNAYGNMNPGQLVQALSQAGALEFKAGFQGNVTWRSRLKHPRRAKYFVVTSKQSGRALGIWKADHGQVTPVLVFVRKTPEYRARLDFAGILRASFERNFPRLMSAALDKMIARFSKS